MKIININDLSDFEFKFEPTVSQQLAFDCLYNEIRLANNDKCFIIIGGDIIVNDEDDWLEL